jgi:hypothetical protein
MFENPVLFPTSDKEASNLVDPLDQPVLPSPPEDGSKAGFRNVVVLRNLTMDRIQKRRVCCNSSCQIFLLPS